jgi:Flp pilus assembly protein TadD
MSIEVAETCRQIAALHTQGSVSAARTAGEIALTKSQDPAIQHLVGVIACQSGDTTRGLTLLRSAYQAKPDEAIAANLVRALIKANALEEAAEVCRAIEPRRPIAGEMTRLHADILSRTGRIADAVAKYRLLVRVQPRDAQIWNNFGNALNAAGDADQAVSALERARSLAPTETLIDINLARALTAAGRHDDTMALLADAAARAPGDGAVLFEYGQALIRAGRAADALPVLGTSARLRRTDPRVLVAIGLAYTHLAQFDRAEQAYRMALRIDSAFDEAFLNLGILYEQSNRVPEIDGLLVQAKRAGTDIGNLAYLSALSLRRAGKFAEALDAVRAATDATDLALRSQLTGQLLDRLGDPAGAFAAFTVMNDATASQPSAQGLAADKYPEDIAAMTRAMSANWAASWVPVTPNDGRSSPIFLVGFPRSGTTLLDTILMGHPDTVVLEEEPLMQRVASMLPDQMNIAGMGDQTVTRLRDRYFAELADIQPDVGDRIVIDKLPLNLLRAPLIHRMFPDARFIFALRHPCDVTLSCFMQNFRINQAMANFLTIDGTARLYDTAMMFWQHCRSILPLNVHEIRYEDLVADLEGEMRGLLDALRLRWSDNILDHQRTAAARGFIRTPSYAQVSERIYSRSAGRWTAYLDQMESALPALAPWVSQFGYAPLEDTVFASRS